MDKSIWNSETIRGGVQLLVLVLGLVGVQIDNAEQVTLTNAVVSSVASIWAIWSFVQVVRGRLKAKRDLTLGGRKL